ncbi:MAG TPA: hypothetical protein VGA51_01050 [Casimicrobiaceae bacterium]
MTPEQIDRVFGRGRLKMVTGEHVEVFREAVAPGERRRYTKRFLNTREGDFGQWTEREWRILARLIGHGIACVPDVVQFDRGRLGGTQLVQTYDAGVTVDQWATLLPVTRDGRVHRHVFEDCAHWWALAHHCLLALNVIHPLELVHLDIKGDNVCIPYAPASFDPDSSDLRLRPVFAQLALIDFAFALVSRESLTIPLPLGWQKEYDYQSPRLLAALEAGRNGELQLTRELDWRCDMYSLAAMLKRHLPDESLVLQPARAAGWTTERYDAAKAFILRIRDCHDSELPAQLTHAALLEQSGARLSEPELALSLERGWTLAREASVSAASASPLTPVTRLAPVTLLAPPVHVTRSGRITAVTVVADTEHSRTAAKDAMAGAPHAAQPQRARHTRGPVAVAAVIATWAVAAAVWYLGDRARPIGTEIQALAEPMHAFANQAADAIRRLVPQGEEAQRSDAVAGQTAAPLTARGDDSPARRPPTAQAEFHESTPPAPPPVAGPAPSELSSASTSSPRQPAAAVISSTANAADAPSVPSSQALREGSSAVLPQQRIVQAGGSAPAIGKKSSLPAPVKQASTPSRASTKLARASSAKAPTAWHAAQSSSTQARRAHASWASLEPPAWLRGGPGPGAPPRAKRHETGAALVASSTEPVSAESPPVAATAPRSELTQTNPQPAQVVAAAPPADPPRAQAGASAIPVRPPDAASTAGDERGAPPAAAAKQTSRGSPSAAPVEDRSEALKFALAQPPTAPEPRVRTADQNTQEDLAAQGRRTLLDTVPRIARQSELEVARVLSIAASAYQPMQDRAVADAARLNRIPDDAWLRARATAPGEARRLTDQARAAFASRRNVLEAFDLQLRAFGANPRDPDVASYLAFLYLKLSPPQPDMARQVALVALATRGSQGYATRMDDWNTFAVASALSGREVDARNALFVTLAVSGSVERTCLSALHALANHGDRLRGPVEAVLYRVRAQGRGNDSPACAWPPNGLALSRLP